MKVEPGKMVEVNGTIYRAGEELPEGVNSLILDSKIERPKNKKSKKEDE